MHTTKENDPFLSREEALSILNTPDDQLDDLIARNSIPHPGFVPAGSLEVLNG